MRIDTDKHGEIVSSVIHQGNIIIVTKKGYLFKVSIVGGGYEIEPL